MTNNQKEKIRELRSKGESYSTIAKKVNLLPSTVKSFCYRNNLVVEEQYVDSTDSSSGRCEYCGKPVNQIKHRKKKRFCSDKCRNKWWNSHLDLVNRKSIRYIVCPNCKKEFSFYGNTPRKYCCHNCYIEYRFNGGNTNG